MEASKHVTVLLSGGIDSTACLAYYLAQEFSASALFIDYGQAAGARESTAAKAVCGHYKVPLDKLTVSGVNIREGGYILGRNAFLLHTALLAFNRPSGIIALGVHAGTTYVDCSEQFIQQAQRSFDLYADGRIRIDAPFIGWNKREIWEYSRQVEAPLDLTYSCELGQEQPCGKCISCLDLEALRAG